MTTDSFKEKSIVPEQFDGDRLLCLRRRAADGLAAALLTFLLLLVTSIAQAATTYSWTGSASALWSNPSNWNPIGVPASGDWIIFPPGASNLSNTNDLPVGTALANVAFSGSGYTVGGNGIVLTGALTGSGVTLNLPIDVQSNAVSINGGMTINGVLSGTGPITMSGSFDFSPGVLSGTSPITLENSGIIELHGTHVYSGTLLLRAGSTVVLHSALVPGANVVMDGYSDKVMGRGTLGSLTTNASTFGMYLWPGDPAMGGAGIINTGNLTLADRSADFQVDIIGAVAGAGYDQINVTGSVTLGNTELSLNMSNSFLPMLGQAIVLIDNDGTDPVNGTFEGLPEGATITLNGFQFQVSYHGGDGNDVTLTSTLVPRRWTGAASALWSNPSNWNPIGVPASGDWIIFPPGASNLSNTNDLPVGTALANVAFSGSGYTVGGNGIVLTGALTGSGVTLNLPIDVQSNAVSINGGMTINGVLSGTGPITMSGSFDFSPGVLSGTSPITLENSGIIELHGTHVYSGTLLLRAGSTVVLHSALVPGANVVMDGYSDKVMGRGTLGSLTTNASTFGMYLWPGDPAMGGAGIINTGNLTLADRSADFQVDIIGAVAGAGYDQINVTGSVTLGNTELSLNMSNSFLPMLGQAIVLIDNDGTDPVNGTFEGLPEGATITLNGFQFQVSYHGGDGNDVTLTSTLVPRRWTGAASALWSNPSNWNPIGVPASGDWIIFPPGASNLSNTNDLPVGTALANVAFSGSGYTVGGNGIVLTGALTGSGVTLNLPIDVQSNAVSINGGMTINGVLSGTGPITMSGSFDFSPGVLSGTSPITLENSGIIELHGTHVYSGTLLLRAGSTVVLHSALVPGANVVMDGYSDKVMGRGTLGSLTTNASTFGMYLWPGDPAMGGAGIINTGNLTLADRSADFQVDIIGAVAGAGYDQINVTGSVTLGNTELSLNMSNSFLPMLGQAIVLIDNDGTDPVNGTFEGLPEGATITLNGFQFQVSYHGGDGNDVTLTSLNGNSASQVSLTSSQNPSTFGVSVTFIATVSGSGATGWVTFKDGANAFCAAVPIVANHAQCTTNELAVGYRPITATYSGNALDEASTSSILTQKVTPSGVGDVWWDVFWRKSDGTNAIWQFTGSGPGEIAASFPPGVTSNWQAKCTGDVNGDGVPDVVWVEPSSGQLATWLMSSPAAISSPTFPASVGTGSSWVLSGIGDINGDGRADLLWRNSSTGQVLVWQMTATGTVASTLDLGVVPLSYALRGVGDFNGDGIGDLLWFQATDGQVAIWLMAANGTHTAVFPGAVGPGTWLPYRVGDFDGDGKADLFWRDGASGMTVVWYMNGGTIADFDFFVSVPLADWDLGSVGDFDLDGRADVMWYAPASGNVVRWLMEGRHVTPTIESLPGVGTGWQMVP